jgi:uncharacterized protein YlxW (UPF0749 family)
LLLLFFGASHSLTSIPAWGPIPIVAPLLLLLLLFVVFSSADKDEEDDALQQQLAAEAVAAAANGVEGPTRVVQVTRPGDIEEVRRALPILGQEQEIMEAVALHDVVVSNRVTSAAIISKNCQIIFANVIMIA